MTRPSGLVLAATTACNRQCPFCALRIPTLPVQHMCLEEVYRIGPLMGKIDVLAVSGGEPTLHPQFEEFTRAVRQAFDFGVLNLATNGARLLEYRSGWHLYDNIGISLYPKHECYHEIASNEALVEQIKAECEPVRHDWLKVRGAQTMLAIYGPIIHGTTPWPSRRTCHKNHTTALILNGLIYPCCAYPESAEGVAITPGWRERWEQLIPACGACLLTR